MLNKTIVLGFAAMLVLAGNATSLASIEVTANLRPSLTLTTNAFGDPFVNVNTPADLALLTARAASRTMG